MGIRIESECALAIDVATCALILCAAAFSALSLIVGFRTSSALADYADLISGDLEQLLAAMNATRAVARLAN